MSKIYQAEKMKVGQVNEDLVLILKDLVKTQIETVKFQQEMLSKGKKKKTKRNNN